MDMGEEISGASSSFDEQNIIFINSLQSYGRQRFNLAHEIYHLNMMKIYNMLKRSILILKKIKYTNLLHVYFYHTMH